MGARDASHPAPSRPLGRVLGHRRGRPHHRRRRATATTPTRRPSSTTSWTRSRARRGSPVPPCGGAGSSTGPGPTSAGDTTTSWRSAGPRPSTSWPVSWRACAPSTATRRSSAAPTAGRAPAASTTPRASCTGSSTASAATPFSVGSYSLGASEVLLPHVVGGSNEVLRRATTWKAILAHTDLVVAFGGMNIKNAYVSPGGVTRHTLRPRLADAGREGPRLRPVQPAAQRPPGPAGGDVATGAARHRHRGDARPGPRARQRGPARHRLPRRLHRRRRPPHRVRPRRERRRGQDARVGIRHLRRRRARTCATSPAAWRRAARWSPSAGPCSAPSTASSRCGWASPSPPSWVRSVSPAAASVTATARWPTSAPRRCPTRCRCSSRAATRCAPTSPSPRSPSCCATRAARSSSTARVLPLPDIRLVYWAGGNPFHHHQDLNRLRRAFARPDTVVVHEPFWTGDRPPRRHRAADDDEPRARRRRWRSQRRLRHRHAPRHRAGGRGP